MQRLISSAMGGLFLFSLGYCWDQQCQYRKCFLAVVCQPFFFLFLVLLHFRTLIVVERVFCHYDINTSFSFPLQTLNSRYKWFLTLSDVYVLYHVYKETRASCTSTITSNHTFNNHAPTIYRKHRTLDTNKHKHTVINNG